MKRLPVILITLALIATAAYLIFRASAAPSQPAALVLAGGTPPAGFLLATGPAPLEFPADHDAHPEYRTEWWYYTGNLDTASGRHFGYQLTFFRQALIPPTEEQPRDSEWATSQYYFAHFALSDVGANQFYSFENIARGAAGIAGTEIDPFRVWVENWDVEQTGEDTYQLFARRDDLVLELTLDDVKGPIFHGEQGYMPSGPGVGDASYYYSSTSMETTGEIQVGGETYTVTGLSWMDHQFGTTGLTPEQVGWDWFSFHLSDGSELMVYQLRQQDGSRDPFSRGTYVAPDGTTTDLGPTDFVIDVHSHWRSPRTEALYPARWTITIPSLDLTLEVDPYMADQELSVAPRYWEGAVKITGRKAAIDLSGSGYVEMTGYAPAN